MLAGRRILICMIMAVFLLPIETMPANNRKLHTVIGICNSTFYPAACESALAGASPTTPENFFTISVQSAKLRAAAAHNAAFRVSLAEKREEILSSATAVRDCIELFGISLEELERVLDASKKEMKSSQDIQTWLSASLTNQITCADGLNAANVEKNLKKNVIGQATALSQDISNALALHVLVNKKNTGGNGERRLSDGFPEWLTARDRKLLAASPADIEADAVVSKDGSGTHSSINEAIAFALEKSDDEGGRTVIHVKAGTYREYIKIPTKQKNVMLIGEGKGQSIIIGSRNAEDGSSTYQSATVAAMGAGFMAKGITIINDSGPNKHQAVALRVGADKAVIYQCSIQGYQDSLYAYANRQFYRDCDISGTVDFIFGNSASVFQNCLIQPRKPASGQKNAITAQGRTDPNQNTGFSIQGCRISGSTGGAPTYLGRPWKQYARVVFMQCEIDGSVSPAGWEPWSGNFALKTLYYGEYGNTGAGARTSARVNWPGVHTDMSASEASKFTVANFIEGTSWIPSGVEFNSGL